ncbi:hypothetical protein Ddye_008585 [Dipteronia dyeriana]|uniref:Uncharacterized protein n=1 Tax=Dipteronia dyeriana TaxID=168575 RepID=A0AAD9XA21_9ROSI|nr:hypothetical protein Ddye_008585 [Dipteronia dyeriana]
MDRDKFRASNVVMVQGVLVVISIEMIRTHFELPYVERLPEGYPNTFLLDVASLDHRIGSRQQDGVDPGGYDTEILSSDGDD